MTAPKKPLLTAASVGRRYVRRDKRIGAAITHHNQSGVRTFIAADGNKYTDSGAWWADSVPHDCDLIRLATPAEISAGHALPVKERKKAEGRRHEGWCFESIDCADGMRGVSWLWTRREARELKRDITSAGDTCGPIFRSEIQCPPWEPKK